MNPKNKYVALLEEQNAHYCNEWRKECLNSLVREACLALASIGLSVYMAYLDCGAGYHESRWLTQRSPKLN